MIRENTTLALAATMTALGLLLVPSWKGELLEPCHLALVAAAFTVVLLLAARMMGARGLATERAVLALFLAGMPMVYLARGGWQWIEGLGLAVFGTCAFLGWRRFAWLLPVGILAHGLAWDSWHYFGGAADIPAWYSLGCMLVDVGVGAYAAVRVAKHAGQSGYTK